MRTMMLAICLVGCSIEFRSNEDPADVSGIDAPDPSGVAGFGGAAGFGGVESDMECAPCPEEPRRLATGDGCERVYTYRPREDDPCRCWLTVTLECGAGGSGGAP